MGMSIKTACRWKKFWYLYCCSVIRIVKLVQIIPHTKKNHINAACIQSCYASSCYNNIFFLFFRHNYRSKGVWGAVFLCLTTIGATQLLRPKCQLVQLYNRKRLQFKDSLCVFGDISVPVTLSGVVWNMQNKSQ